MRAATADADAATVKGGDDDADDIGLLLSHAQLIESIYARANASASVSVSVFFFKCELVI